MVSLKHPFEPPCFHPTSIEMPLTVERNAVAAAGVATPTARVAWTLEAAASVSARISMVMTTLPAVISTLTAEISTPEASAKVAAIDSFTAGV